MTPEVSHCHVVICEQNLCKSRFGAEVKNAFIVISWSFSNVKNIFLAHIKLLLLYMLISSAATRLALEGSSQLFLPPLVPLKGC